MLSKKGWVIVAIFLFFYGLGVIADLIILFS